MDDERKYSDPNIYDNSIDFDDSTDGSEGGYTAHGSFIVPDAMMELVQLRRQRDALLAAAIKVITISDRKHDAWDELKAAIAAAEAPPKD